MKDSMFPWKEIYDLALNCCQFYDVKGFAVSVITELNKLIAFDEAIVFFLDGNKKVEDYYLYNMNPKWMNLYMSYYSQSDSGAFGISQRNLDAMDDVYIHEWDIEASREFIPDYIRPRHLVSSLGFPLRDMAGSVRTIIVLDRLTAPIFSEDDKELVKKIRALISKYHKLLCNQPLIGENRLRRLSLGELTKREIEVVNLLSQGLSPDSIAHILHISVPTTNRHIYNIYQKLNVNSRHELMSKIGK